jgi:hypothetical protein
VKAVITSTTDINDIKIFSRILKGVKGKYSVILQPVTALKGKAEIPDEEMLDIFRAYVNKETNSNVSILGQFHSVLGIK